jgi:molybdopterin adenylyltransferase
MSDLKIGILTCSDSRGEAEDSAGRALSALIAERGWILSAYQCCKDDLSTIQAAIIEMAEGGADVVLTCGGTGLGPRDVTPEATAAACDRPVPGIAEHIRAESLKVTGRAMLSRATAAARGRTLVINLPGSEKAARECFGFVADQFEHAADMMRGGGH